MATRKRGRPARIMSDEAPSSSPRVAVPPLPAAKRTPAALIVRVCAHLGITLDQVRRWDGGGGTLEVVTEDGRRLLMERADLREP